MDRAIHEIWFVHDTQFSPAIRRAALERAGWRVRTTTKASEALAWFMQGAPALCVIDVLIEGRTGFELCRTIRERHTAEELPIVLGCSIYQEPEHAAEAVRAGAQRYLALPVEPEVLVATIAELSAGAQDVRAA
jgi:chemotaxis family two-component system response regulator PixH